MPAALALLTFVVSVAYVPLIPSAAVAGRWAVAGIGAALLLRGVVVRAGSAHWMGLGLLAWTVAGLAWTVSEWEHLGGALRWGLVAAPLFCVAAETRDLRPFWTALCLGVGVSACFSIAQRLELINMQNLLPVGIVSWGGLYLSKSAAAEIAAVALVGALCSGRWLLAVGPTASLLLVAPLQHPPRAAVLAVLVGLSTWIWLRLPPYRQFVALIWLTFVGCAAWLVWDGALYDPRLEIWGRVLRNLNLWGDGMDSFSIAVVGYEYAHSEFLQLAFDLGVGSLLVWGIAVHALRCEDHVPERAALAALLALCAFGYALHEPTTLLAASVLAGHLAGARLRLGASQLERRVLRGACVPDADALGVGAPVAADAGRLGLAPRSQRQVGSTQLRASAGARAGALLLGAALLFSLTSGALAQGGSLFYRNFFASARAPDLNATTTTARVELGVSVTVARVCNLGLFTAYVQTGVSTVEATIDGSVPILSGRCEYLNVSTATYLAAITTEETTLLQITLGYGNS